MNYSHDEKGEEKFPNQTDHSKTPKPAKVVTTKATARPPPRNVQQQNDSGRSCPVCNGKDNCEEIVANESHGIK